ncbi:hypothetical protein ScPMuIL_003374 [Solemya velum]
MVRGMSISGGSDEVLFQKKKGCYVTRVKGVILGTVAVVAVVAVALIVHFTGEESTALGGVADANIGERPTTTTTTEAPAPKEKRDVRLPATLAPRAYDVRLRPNMYDGPPEEFHFNGSVTIEIECIEATRNITLHANKLNITNGSVVVTGGDVAFESFELDTELQFLIVNLTKETVPGEIYNLSMDFVGPLEDGLDGLYLSSYKQGSDTIYVTTTQFQPTDARKAFPCFDEPAIKATFRITLERKTDQKALSNMPIHNHEPLEADWVADHFEETAKMSTYLLALGPDRTHSYRAWARPDAREQTLYGLHVGVEVLTHFEEFFNISYPLPKQDMIALPDFGAGAMENWGLITYRETAMLYDPEESSEGNKQRVAVVVAHEVAHQWFGNLVTPSWWDDLWLNEGFASYLEYSGVVHVEKDWGMWEQYIVDDLHSALSFDGLVASHPLFVPVADPAEISSVFDSISYLKGSSVIRMARFFLGDDTFRKGLSNYLKSLEYGAATHNDLWYAWGNQSVADSKDRTDVKKIMDTWVLQMNYPVVTVTSHIGKLHVKQKRFLIDPDAVDPGIYNSTYGYMWEIPFTYTHEDELNFTASRINWFGNESAVIFIEYSFQEISDGNLPDPSDKWILANVRQYGYYRVNYDDHNWRELIRQLDNNHTVIPTENRAQIVNDAWNLARAGELNMSIALDTTKYLKDERNYVPWDAALSQLGFVDTMLQRNGLNGDFSKYMLRLVEDYFSELTMDNTNATHLESYRRSQISSTACDYGVASCVEEAKALYRAWMNATDSKNPINPGVRFTVYCTAIRHGGQAEWDFAYEQHRNSNVAGELSRLRGAMACSRQTWILSRYLERTIQPEEIRKQDAVGTITTIAANPVGRPLAWDFIRAKWEYLNREYGQGSFSFANLISGTTSSFNTEYELKQLADFKDDHPDLGSGARAFDRAIERTKSNIKWMEKNVPPIRDWLANYFSTT